MSKPNFKEIAPEAWDVWKDDVYMANRPNSVVTDMINKRVQEALKQIWNMGYLAGKEDNE